jgi:hypothetical protein
MAAATTTTTDTTSSKKRKSDERREMEIADAADKWARKLKALFERFPEAREPIMKKLKGASHAETEVVEVRWGTEGMGDVVLVIPKYMLQGHQIAQLREAHNDPKYFYGKIEERTKLEAVLAEYVTAYNRCKPQPGDLDPSKPAPKPPGYIHEGEYCCNSFEIEFDPDDYSDD